MLDHAAAFNNITDLDKSIVMHAKKTILFNNETSWWKKNNTNDLFDVPMGSHDAAETCELVVCYLLAQRNKELENTSLGLYRDDGLAVSHSGPQKIEKIKKRTCKIFENNNLI